VFEDVYVGSVALPPSLKNFFIVSPVLVRLNVWDPEEDPPRS
jgi:hypothetical protein